jgi:hypothetical protein
MSRHEIRRMALSATSSIETPVIADGKLLPLVALLGRRFSNQPSARAGTQTMPNPLSIDPPFELLIFQWLGIVLDIRFWQTGNAKPAIVFKAE